MDMTKPREDLNPGRVKKVALVHEWLTTYAGSDKVLAVIISLFPDADLFCLIDHLPEMKERRSPIPRSKRPFCKNSHSPNISIAIFSR